MCPYHCGLSMIYSHIGSCVGLICGLFSTLLSKFFERCSGFTLSIKTNTSIVVSTWNKRTKSHVLCGYVSTYSNSREIFIV